MQYRTVFHNVAKESNRMAVVAQCTLEVVLLPKIEQNIRFEFW